MKTMEKVKASNDQDNALVQSDQMSQFKGEVCMIFLFIYNWCMVSTIV